MWPDRVSNPGPLTYESGALPIALRGPAGKRIITSMISTEHISCAGCISRHGRCMQHRETQIVPSNYDNGITQARVRIYV